MKKYLIWILVISMMCSLLVGCGSGNKTEATNSNSETSITSENGLNGSKTSGDSVFGAGYVDPNNGPTGKPIVTPKPGPVGDWDIPIPLINPLGSQALYNGGTNNQEDSNASIDIQYIENFTEYQKRLYGNSWWLAVEEDSGIPVAFLTEYVNSIGGTVFSSAYADHMIFKVDKEDASWWCDVRENENGYEFHIVKQDILLVGKSYTITSNRFQDGVSGGTSFITQIIGEKFISIHVGIPSGKVVLMAECVDQISDSAIYKRYTKVIDASVSKDFILDDLPQGAGIYNWSIVPYDYNVPVPDEITLMFEESYDLPKVKMGINPGALLVKGAPFGSVMVEPQKFVSVDYREGTQQTSYGESAWYKGTVTVDGDTLFVLPPGYWTVVNSAPYMDYGSTKAQLIPVSTGEQTTVTLPDSLKSANARLNSMGDSSELTGSIEMKEAKDLTASAEISISVSDPLERDISPTKDNTTLYESGTKVEITKIVRTIAPSNIALVIDSSGSMKNDMKATLDAAKAFLEALPVGSTVKIVDFDAQVRLLKGETPAEAIKNLGTITAGGATKLYDATLKGIEVVTGKSKPAVVVFTDGIDSREDKTGSGSATTRSAVVEKLKEGKIPVYTIGFGKRLNTANPSSTPVDGVPDIQCLLEFAEVSSGQYYPAKDPNALTEVFAAIASKLGNNFVITYTRPQESNISTTPFISMVVDNSGSMNLAPSEGIDCNFRMEKTVSMFHDFISKLPQDVMMQFATFQTPAMSPPLIIQQQITTMDRSTLLKSLGAMDSQGGTPIVEALRTAYENILPVPSSRKAILLLTDGGLEVEPEQLEQFNSLLQKIKDKNITVLFVGMGVQSKEALFQNAAAASGGDFVISEDVADIQVKLDQLLQTLKQPLASPKIPLSVSIDYRSPTGDALTYATATEVAFSAPKKAGTPMAPDTIKISTGTPFERYSQKVSASITGMGSSGVDTIIVSNMAINKKLSNTVMEMTVTQEAVFSKFMGIDNTNTNLQFVALQIQLQNTSSQSIAYEIPSIFNHFYLGINGEGLYPASKATWLTEKPLSPHGNPEIKLEAGEKREGVLVFVVPETEGISQQSLHFYDTDNGHIQMPLTGKMPEKWLALTKLPATAPAKMTDAFTLKVTAGTIASKIEQYDAGEKSTFRIVEGQFESKVQALLNLEPKDRILLKIDTASGALMSRMSDVTAALPFGFLEPIMMGPAAINPVRFAYDLPVGMTSFKSSLYVDLATGNAEIPLTATSVYSAPKPVAIFDGDGMKVIINQLTNLNNDEIALDVTFKDLPGNDGVKIPPDFFCLVNKDYVPTDSDSNTSVGRIGLSGSGLDNTDVLTPKETTNDLVFGVGDDFGVFDGQSRRGIVLFSKPDAPINWTLQSRYLSSIQVPIIEGKFASPELIGYKKSVEIDRAFQNNLDLAVNAAIEKFKPLSNATAQALEIDMNGQDDRIGVPMPPISTYGLRTIEGLNSEKIIISLLQGLNCLPLNRDTGSLQTYGYLPEAVITQGWGDIGDMTNLTKQLMSRLGFAPKVRALAFTDAGKKLLLDLSGVDPTVVGTVPLGVSYTNDTGERKMMVIPFMHDLSELAGLIYMPSEKQEGYMIEAEKTAKVSVFVQYLPGETTGTAAGTSGDSGAALGGDEGENGVQELLMLEKDLKLKDLSADAFDISFMPRNGMGKTKSYNALLSWAGGIETSSNVLEDPKQVLGIRIQVENINGVGRPLEHYKTLAEGDSLDNFFYTIALNLPDLTEEAAAMLEDTNKKVHDSVSNPDPISIAKWYGRSILYHIISGQTMYDTQMVGDLKLVLGRINSPRVLIVGSHLDKDGIMHTEVDLLQAFNEVHAGEEAAARAYTIGSGLYMSTLEAQALPGTNKAGYQDLWAAAPDSTSITCIPVLDDGRDALFDEMNATSIYPKPLLDAVIQNEKMLFVPTNPTVFNGQKRWAWLEVDPLSYQIISVFDTGLHSSFAEFNIALLPSMDDTVKYMKGVWIGTNVSVWTMCSSTLKYGDQYSRVLNDAKKVATEVGKVLEAFLSMSGKIASPEIGDGMDLPGGTHKIDFNMSMSGIKGSISQNILDFSKGYQDAVDAYFNMITPKLGTYKK